MLGIQEITLRVLRVTGMILFNASPRLLDVACSLGYIFMFDSRSYHTGNIQSFFSSSVLLCGMKLREICVTLSGLGNCEGGVTRSP